MTRADITPFQCGVIAGHWYGHWYREKLVAKSDTMHYFGGAELRLMLGFRKAFLTLSAGGLFGTSAVFTGSPGGGLTLLL